MTKKGNKFLFGGARPFGVTASMQTGLFGDGGWAFATSYVQCKHWRTPVTVGEYTVYASAASVIGDNFTDEPIPELGIYLDDKWWSRTTGFAGVGIAAPVKWHWPFIIFDWPDMSMPGANEVDTLLSFAVKHIKGGKRVEIGCMGAHGRTGTMLAMLRVKLGGANAKHAIDTLRKDYCDRVVESDSQVKAVYAVAGEKLPKQKATPTGSKEYVYTSYASYHTSVYTNQCGSCGHNEFQHERAQTDYKRTGCAYSQYLSSAVSVCSCKVFMGKPTGNILKTYSTVQQQTKNLLPAIAVPASTEYEAHMNALKSWPQDKCDCGHRRKSHTLLGFLCKADKCECEEFTFSAKQNLVKGGGA